MNLHSRLALRPLGLAATATLAMGVAVAVPAPVAAADLTEVPTAAVQDGTLTVLGTRGADHITIGVAAAAPALLVDLGTGAPALSFDRATFRTVSVMLGRGDDTFAVYGGGQFSDIPLTVSGGRGDDSISGSNGVDVLYGGRGDDVLRGKDGNDMLFGGSGDDNVDGERGVDAQVLGSGDDTALWLPGEGSDVTEGGSGHDTLAFVGANAAEKFAVSANGTRSLLTRDLGGIRMDQDGVEQLDLATLGGADTVAVGDLTGTALTDANLDLAAVGGGGDGATDTVTVAGTAGADDVEVGTARSNVVIDGLHTVTRLSGSETRDQLQVNAGAGNDTVSVNDTAKALVSVSVDLGADQS
jgi:Ca2+-binding RTX toxin-like protein